MYQQYFKTLLQICFLTKGPQDMPSGMFFAKLSLGILLAVNVISLIQVQALSNIFQSIIQLGVVTGFVFLILKGKSLESRLAQTLSAVFGTNAILAALLLIAQFIFMGDVSTQELANQSAEELAQQHSPIFSFLLVIAFWNFVVDAHIIRNALNVSFGIGLLYAFAMSAVVLLTYMVLPK